MSLHVGFRLGAYEVLGPLGKGGMGEVWRARDTRLSREVALKVLPESLAQDPQRLERFDREARLLASLDHPHIARIHGLEEAEGVRALVLELVAGETLADWVARGRSRERNRQHVDEALSIARQVADALDAAHAKGIVHRDLKPANVMLTEAGVVKVLDFGLAKAIEPPPGAAPEAPTMAMDATHAGEIDADLAEAIAHARERALIPAGYAGVHEPRAGARATARPAHRRLGLRLPALLDVDVFFDGMRSDPRYAELLSRRRARRH